VARLRLVLALRLALAHLAGLAALAGWFAASGDSLADDVGFFFLNSAAASLPVFAALVTAVMLFARWVEDNLLTFVLAGPVLLCFGASIVAGIEMAGVVVIAAATASLIFAALAFFDWPSITGHAA